MTSIRLVGGPLDGHTEPARFIGKTVEFPWHENYGGTYAFAAVDAQELVYEWQPTQDQGENP